MLDQEVQPVLVDPVCAGDRLHFPGTDLEVTSTLRDGDLTLDVKKAGQIVYRVVIEQAAGRLENAWIADLFCRYERIRMEDISGEMAEYLGSLDIAQG